MYDILVFFPDAHKIELLKDPGLIPEVLKKKYKLKTGLVCFKNDLNENILNSKIYDILIMKQLFNFKLLNEIVFMIKYAKKTKFLMMFHLDIKHHFPIVFLYKILNPHGKLYLKLDIDLADIDRIYKKGKIKFFLSSYLLKKYNYVSAESTKMCDIISELFDIKPLYIQDGTYLNNHIDLEKKENIFLTVGRLGSDQKNTFFLLNSFIKTIGYHDFKLVCVGSITEELKKYIEEKIKSNTEIKDRIIFTGPIYNKNVLESYYERSKYFLLPSKWGSFELVICEAMQFGCYCVVSNLIPSTNDLFNNKYGSVVPINSEKYWEKEIVKLSKIELSKEYLYEISCYINNNFTWNNVAEKIYNFIINDEKS